MASLVYPGLGLRHLPSTVSLVRGTRSTEAEPGSPESRKAVLVDDGRNQSHEQLYLEIGKAGLATVAQLRIIRFFGNPFRNVKGSRGNSVEYCMEFLTLGIEYHAQGFKDYVIP